MLAGFAYTALHGKSMESTYRVPDGLVLGGAFMDRFLPVPVQDGLETDVWGAPNVVPRDAHNGIEDAEYSYWGGNMIHGDDGKEHLFVCRWPEDHPKGHHIWWDSEVVHCTSDQPIGPFEVVEVIGKGHNPEIYQTQDGSYVIGIIGGAYRSKSLSGPWERFDVVHDSFPAKGRIILVNKTYVRQADGSVLMMTKRGQVYVSQDGMAQFKQVTHDPVYPPVESARFEDPVIWKDEVQYHLVVNDWYGRTAFYMRSPDGVHWKWAPGKAYDPSIMQHVGGTHEAWYKFERPKVRQDPYGRVTHMNFAVIDVPKDDDKGSDNHSSKHVVIPLTVARRLVILNKKAITPETQAIRVKLLAEEGFDPHTDIDLQSLRFGAPEQVNFGKGCAVTDAKPHGSDLIVTFAGKGNGLTEDNFTAKLIGRTHKGSLLFGYARLPESAADFTGNWALVMPNGQAGWLSFAQENRETTGQLWTVGSPKALTALTHDGSMLQFKRRCALGKPDYAGGPPTGKKLLVQTHATIHGESICLTMECPMPDGTFDNVSFEGKRMPPLPPKPDLNKIQWGDRINLFNGHDLTGWRLTNAHQLNGWKAINGELVNTTPKLSFDPYSHYGNLRTDRKFMDFNLHIEFNVPPGGNSGVYLRGVYEAQVVDRDSRMQGIQGVGAIFGRIVPTENAGKPGGQWQVYDVTLVDRHVTVVLNGKTVIDNQPIAGCTNGAIQADETIPGPLYLQGDHTAVRYRNIVLRPVKKD